MKKQFQLHIRMIGLIIWVGILSSCEDRNDLFSQDDLSDAELISAIQSSDQTDVSLGSLPSNAVGVLTTAFSTDAVTSARMASGLGFQIGLTTESGVNTGLQSEQFFNLEGRLLNPVNTAAGRGGFRGNHGGGPRGRSMARCLELVYPITVTMPDNTDITLSSQEDWSIVREWHTANPDADSRGTINFPVTVVNTDGEHQEVSDESELAEAASSCQGGGAGTFGRCFELQFPFEVTMADGTVITLNSEADHSQIAAWYQSNPDYRGERPDLNFPLTLLYEDGTSAEVNDQEEFRAVISDCRN